jgi:hypothetical protein
MNHFNRIYRTPHLKGKSKLLYADSYRSFYSNCRSNGTVVNESHKDKSLAVTEQRFLVRPKFAKCVRRITKRK